MELIEKEKIKAEIESLQTKTSIGLNEYTAGYENGKAEVCGLLLNFINSLQKEPVSENLEEEIHNQAMKLHTAPTYEELRNFALHFVEWQKEQMLKDAIEGEVYFSFDLLKNRLLVDIPSKYKEGDKVKLITIKEN